VRKWSHITLKSLRDLKLLVGVKETETIYGSDIVNSEMCVVSVFRDVVYWKYPYIFTKKKEELSSVEKAISIIDKYQDKNNKSNPNPNIF
jgi:hypothetical protein